MITHIKCLVLAVFISKTTTTTVMSSTNAIVAQLPIRPRIYSPTTPSFYNRPAIFTLPSRSTSLSITTTKLKNAQRQMATKASVSADPSKAAIGEILGDVAIFTASGEPVMFKDLWDQNEGMAVVSLLRHFGCPCSWELASALKDSKERFEAAGVKVIAVGVGTPDKAQILAERLPFPVDSLYCDPERKAYDVLGLYYGLGRTFFSPASAKLFTRFSSLKQAVKNYTIKATPKDRSGVLQQGGMFVFKGKELLYSRKDEGTGDHAPLNQILDLCCSVPVA